MAPPTTLTNKLKVQLKLSIQRLRMHQQKSTAIAKQQRRLMAELLGAGKLESARIRVEGIIRSDIETELHEILELYCELMLARIGLLESQYTVPAWLKDEVSGKGARDGKASTTGPTSGSAAAIGGGGVAARLASVLTGRSSAPTPSPCASETDAQDADGTSPAIDLPGETARPLIDIPDAGLCESILSVIYAAPKLTDTKELSTARALLLEKVGREVGIKLQQATTPEEALALGIPERVVKRLNNKPPGQALVDGYLREIGRFYGVKWPGAPESDLEEEDEDDDDGEGGIKESIEATDIPEFEDENGGDSGPRGGDDDDAGGGGGGGKERPIPLSAQELSRATPPRETIGKAPPLKIAPPSPSTENVHPTIKLPGADSTVSKPGDSPLGKKSVKKGGGAGSGARSGNGTGGGGGIASSSVKKDTAPATKKEVETSVGSKKDGPGGKVPDVDELSKRFEALKRV